MKPGSNTPEEENMKTGLKAMLLAFIVTTMISCAFPATAIENCSVGISAGVSNINNRIESIERREFRYSGDILLKTSEKKIGFPHEIYAKCRYEVFGMSTALAVGHIGNFTASVATDGIVYVRPLDEKFEGSIVRRAEASGWSISGLVFKRLSPRTEAYLRIGAVYATGLLTIEAKQYPDIFVGTKRSAWIPRAGIGLRFKATERTYLGIEAGAFTKKDTFLLGSLGIKL